MSIRDLSYCCVRMIGEQNSTDSDRLKGKTKEVAGRVQKRAGMATGDAGMEARSEAREQEGKAQDLFSISSI